MQGDKRRWCTWRKERRAKKTEGSGRGGRHPGTRGGVPTPPNNTRGLTIPISCCRKPYAIRKANLRSNKSYKAPKGRPDIISRDTNFTLGEKHSQIENPISDPRRTNFKTRNPSQIEKSISDRKPNLKSQATDLKPEKSHLRSKNQSQIEQILQGAKREARSQIAGIQSQIARIQSQIENPISDRGGRISKREIHLRSKNPFQIENPISNRGESCSQPRTILN